MKNQLLRQLLALVPGRGSSLRAGATGAVIILATTLPLISCSSAKTTLPSQPAQAAFKIKHIVVIMQENRSFDSYFGTYPGADGIPMQNGVPTVCVNNPAT